MDERLSNLWKRVILLAIGTIAVGGVLGALYFWIEVGQTEQPVAATEETKSADATPQTDLQASARALREAAAKLQSGTSTDTSKPSAQLEASQSALQKATVQNSGPSGPSQADLEASQKALEAATQKSQ